MCTSMYNAMLVYDYIQNAVCSDTIVVYYCVHARCYKWTHVRDFSRESVLIVISDCPIQHTILHHTYTHTSASGELSLQF